MTDWTMVLDESLHEQLLTVGGFIAPTDRLAEIADGWRRLKTGTFGIAPESELKYTFPGAHPTRRALNATGWSQRRRVPEMLRAIRDLDLLLLTDTLVDLRRDEAGKSPRDFYLYALKWCVRRLANHTEGDDGTHWVVVDMYKDLGKEPFGTFQKQYWKKETFGFGSRTAPPLRDCGLSPMLVTSHASHSDVLQIADLVAGCVREFCAYNLTRADVSDLPKISYEDRNMALIAPSIRSGWSGIRGYGFDIFPRRHPARDGLVSWATRLATESDRLNL